MTDTDLELDETPAEQIKTTDDAFRSAMTPKEINGVELLPFTLERRTISLEISGLSASAFREAVVQVWSCTQTEKQLYKAARDDDSKAAAQSEAFKWAESIGCSFANSKPLLDLYTLLNAEISASTKVMQDDSEGPEPKNSGGPLA